MTAGARAAACLGIGMALWVLFGAVRGAADWQVSGGAYLVGLLTSGSLLGLVARPRSLPRHLSTGALLVLPGFATLVASGPDAHPNAPWWYLTLALGLFAAAATHRLAVEVRRLVPRLVARWAQRRSALAGGPNNQ